MEEDRFDENSPLLRIIIEVLGAPAEHVEEALRLLLKQLKEKGNMQVAKGEVFKAEPAGDFFTSFAEVEIRVQNLDAIAELCFEFMPSSIEILEPAEIRETTKRLSDFLNDLMARLHEVDMRLKTTNAENILLNKNLTSLLRNFVVLALQGHGKGLAELSGNTGLDQKVLAPFLADFVKQEIIKEADGLYCINEDRLKWKI